MTDLTPDRIEVEGDKPKVGRTIRYFTEIRASLLNGADALRDLKTEVARLEAALDAERARLVEALEYIEHQSWRCQYRSRYKRCVCGLDELCDQLGIERLLPNDPEAPS